MSDWLLRRSYGFGAARVALCAEPHTAAGTGWTVREGVREARASAGTWRDVIGVAPAIAMGIAITLAPLLALLQQSLIAPDIDLVVLEAAARSELPPAPAIPRPPPVEVVEKVPPPTAAPTPPKPPPVVAATRPQRAPTPTPAAPPRIEPVPLAAPAPETAARRTSRSPAPVATAPAFQPVVARIDPLAKTEVAATGNAPRRVGPRAAGAANRRPPPPVRFDASMPTTPTTPEDRPRQRSTRPELQRDHQPTRRERPAGISVPAAQAPEISPHTLAAAQTPAPVRPERRRDGAPAESARASRPGVAGVALASLASCRTDAQEDDLKQRVLAEVAGRGQCESTAGRYVFVETRNLNAFLMYVQRPPARREADRCVELSLALDCLRQRGGSKAGRV